MNEDLQCIKAVPFDLWETLLFEKNGASAQRTTARCKNLTNAFNKFGLDVSTEQVFSAMNETINSLLKVWDNNIDITHAEQLTLIIKKKRETRLFRRPYLFRRSQNPQTRPRNISFGGTRTSS